MVFLFILPFNVGGCIGNQGSVSCSWLVASWSARVFIDDLIVLVCMEAFAAWFRIIQQQMAFFSLECQPIKSKAFVPNLPANVVCPAIADAGIQQTWTQMELLGTHLQLATPIGLHITRAPSSTTKRVVAATSVCAHLAAMLSVSTGRWAVRPVVCNLLRNVNLAMSYDVHVLPRAVLQTEVDAFDDLVNDVILRLICQPVMASNEMILARLHVARGGLGLLSLADRAIGGILFSTLRLMPMLIRRSASLSAIQLHEAFGGRLRLAGQCINELATNGIAICSNGKVYKLSEENIDDLLKRARSHFLEVG